MLLLNKEYVALHHHDEILELMQLPERVIQFGTGVLLRGLPDYYIHKANQQKIFNGRIVIVKSTDQGDITPWADQDYLYTHCIKGIENGQLVETAYINSSISRVLIAKTQWPEILKCAADPDINIILSNTTEKGLTYVQEDVMTGIPKSFPGKILAYLFHRFLTLGVDKHSKIVIVPTELIEDNGDLLHSFVLQCAKYNKLEDSFFQWFDSQVSFCNSLVDRIVPGKPQGDANQELEQKLGYKDEYIIVSEPFNLWAIEGNESVKNILSFHVCNPNIKIVEDISLFKELKLRLLNATHILICGSAILNGYKTVADALSDRDFQQKITSLLGEIKISLPKKIEDHLIEEFSASVMSRFANPFIHHMWISIIFNYTEKLKIRTVPLIEEYFNNFGVLPTFMIEGFASFFYISIPDLEENGIYYKFISDEKIRLNDTFSKVLFDQNQREGPQATIRTTLNYFFDDIGKSEVLKSKMVEVLINKYFEIKNPIMI